MADFLDDPDECQIIGIARSKVEAKSAAQKAINAVAKAKAKLELAKSKAKLELAKSKGTATSSKPRAASAVKGKKQVATTKNAASKSPKGDIELATAPWRKRGIAQEKSMFSKDWSCNACRAKWYGDLTKCKTCGLARDCKPWGLYRWTHRGIDMLSTGKEVRWREKMGNPKPMSPLTREQFAALYLGNVWENVKQGCLEEVDKEARAMTFKEKKAREACEARTRIKENNKRRRLAALRSEPRKEAQEPELECPSSPEAQEPELECPSTPEPYFPESPKPGEDDDRPAVLAKGWEEKKARQTGQLYYVNAKLNHSQLNFPTEKGDGDLPEGWERRKSESTGKLFFWHEETQRSQFWHPSKPGPLPPGWKEIVSKTTGKKYYFHEELGATQIEYPVLPAGWEAITSKSTGKVYFWNAELSKSQMDYPTA